MESALQSTVLLCSAMYVRVRAGAQLMLSATILVEVISLIRCLHFIPLDVLSGTVESSTHQHTTPCNTTSHHITSHWLALPTACQKSRSYTAPHVTAFFYSTGWEAVQHTTRYHTALFTLHCTVLHRTAPHCTAPYCTALHCTALHCTALHCTLLHCAAPHCTALYCTALYRRDVLRAELMLWWWPCQPGLQLGLKESPLSS